jgi:hypothetical protein
MSPPVTGPGPGMQSYSYPDRIFFIPGTRPVCRTLLGKRFIYIYIYRYTIAYTNHQRVYSKKELLTTVELFTSHSTSVEEKEINQL